MVAMIDTKEGSIFIYSNDNNLEMNYFLYEIL